MLKINKYIATVNSSKILNVTFGIFNIYHKGHEDLFRRMGYNRLVGICNNHPCLPFDYRVRAISTSNLDDLEVVISPDFGDFISGFLDKKIRLFIDSGNYNYCRNILDELNLDLEIVVPEKSLTKSCEYLKDIHSECNRDVKLFYEKGRDYFTSYDMALFAFRAIDLLSKGGYS